MASVPNQTKFSTLWQRKNVEVEFDILGITETHLNEDISNELTRIHGYNMVRRDRSNGLKGSGVVIYYRNNLNIFEDLK